MTEEQKAALDWLDWWTKQTGQWESRAGHARTLKDMLAEPRLPKEPTGVLLAAMDEGFMSSLNPSHDVAMRAIYHALYAHLTKPATEKVWHIVFCNKHDGGSYRKDGYRSREAALSDAAHFLREGHAICIEQIEVPA